MACRCTGTPPDTRTRPVAAKLTSRCAMPLVRASQRSLPYTRTSGRIWAKMRFPVFFTSAPETGRESNRTTRLGALSKNPQGHAAPATSRIRARWRHAGVPSLWVTCICGVTCAHMLHMICRSSRQLGMETIHAARKHITWRGTYPVDCPCELLLPPNWSTTMPGGVPPG
jgi:hypothetical protein